MHFPLEHRQDYNLGLCLQFTAFLLQALCLQGLCLS